MREAESIEAAERELQSWLSPIATWSLFHGACCALLLFLDFSALSASESRYLAVVGSTWLASAFLVWRFRATGSKVSGVGAAITQAAVVVLILSWAYSQRRTIVVASWLFLDGVLDVLFHALGAVGLLVTLKKHEKFLT